MESIETLLNNLRLEIAVMLDKKQPEVNMVIDHYLALKNDYEKAKYCRA